MNDTHERSTLMQMKKEELVEYVMCLEHNNAAMAESFEIQNQNCMQMIADMNLLNDTMKKSCGCMALAAQAGEGGHKGAGEKC